MVTHGIKSIMGANLRNLSWTLVNTITTTNSNADASYVLPQVDGKDSLFVIFADGGVHDTQRPLMNAQIFVNELADNSVNKICECRTGAVAIGKTGDTVRVNRSGDVYAQKCLFYFYAVKM